MPIHVLALTTKGGNPRPSNLTRCSPGSSTSNHHPTYHRPPFSLLIALIGPAKPPNLAVSASTRPRKITPRLRLEEALTRAPGSTWRSAPTPRVGCDAEIREIPCPRRYSKEEGSRKPTSTSRGRFRPIPFESTPAGNLGKGLPLRSCLRKSHRFLLGVE
ncbi:hypothetical protein KM043_013136 [Ampulex compressa]|nr:hypothetical protein KM043_013136 [Ampulex compressa]